jgi:GNAT superfamily N-acetyltransferase
MLIREATAADIPVLSNIRLSVHENVLSNPSLISAADYSDYLTQRGKGWLVEEGGEIVAFAIIDLAENNVWALFVAPQHERKGFGAALHDEMLDWYFGCTEQPLWLGTSPGTKAEKFYISKAWKIAGMRENGEIKFEMTMEDWLKQKSPSASAPAV